MTYEELINSPAGEFVMFASKDGKVRIECRFESDTLWLSQATICELYGKAKATISGHIKNIFDEGELVENSVVRFYRTTASMVKYITFNTLACPSFSPSAIASDPREVRSSASGPPKRSRNTWLKASLWTTSA